MNMHTRVMMEKVKSAYLGKKICLMSSARRVMMVTIVIKMEKNNPSKNYKIFYIKPSDTLPVSVSPKNKEHLVD